VYDADNDVWFRYGDKAGKWSTILYQKLRAIQYGDEPDLYGWTQIIG
jgi:branched-chain amino acid aminotransferase